MIRAVVTGLDRTNRVAYCQPPGGPIIAATPAGDLPCPRSQVLLEEVGAGGWVVVGQIAPRRVVLHDDFTALLNPAGTVWTCDTAWTQYGSGAGSITGAGFGGDQGWVGIATGAGAGDYYGLRKIGGITFNPAGPEALWLSGQLRLSTYSQVAVIVGIDSDGSNDFSGIAGADAGVSLIITNNTATANVDPYLRTIKAGVQTTTGSPAADLTGSWDFDLVCNNGWAALWVNGAGPVVSTGVPGTSEGLNIAAAVYAYTASARVLYVDWLHLERVGYAIQPE